VIREALRAVARNEALGGLVGRAPGASEIVKRVVGGETLEAALEVATDLADRGFWISLERAAPSIDSDEAALRVAEDYAELVSGIATAGLADVCDATVFPEALGLRAEDGALVAHDRLVALARQAESVGVSLMLGIGPLADAEVTIGWAEELWAAGLPIGLTVAACLRRTEADCARLADHRIRLVKGVYGGDPSIAHSQPIEVDKAYVRAAKKLLAGDGSASFATHDARLIEIVESLARRYGRSRQSYEFTFFMGRQEGAQERLLGAGERVRVYVPYGPDWFERLVGGLAEQPSTIAAAVRSLLPGAS
jgi:proline dehydrogenase